MNRSAIETTRDDIEGRIDGISLFLMTDFKSLSNRFLKISVTNDAVPLLRSFVVTYLGLVLKKVQDLGTEDVNLLDYDSDQWVSRLSLEAVENYPLEQPFDPTDYLRMKQVKPGRIRAWVVQTTIDSERVYFFQRFFPSKMLKAKGLNFLQQEECFKPITQPLLSIGETFDCFSLNGDLIISNLANFEAIFKYDQAYKKKSEEFVAQVAEGVLSETCKIENIDLVSGKLLANKNYNKKIYRIMQHKRYEKIDFKRLSSFVEKHEMALGVNGSDGKIVIQDNTPCDTLLNVLNDDYSRSQITPYEYVTEKKREFG